MKLTDTQMQLLAAAAEHQDRLAKPPAIPPGPRGAIEAKLRAAGLIEQVRLGADEHPAMAWRHADGEAIGYRITEAGLAAVGPDAVAGADMAPQGAAESTEGGQPSAGTRAGRQPTRAAGGPSRAKHRLVRHTAPARPPDCRPGGARRLG
jgi:hypothetical protein